MYKRSSWLGLCLFLSVSAVHAQKYEQYRNADPAELIKRKDITEDELGAIQRYYQFQAKDAKRAATLEQLLIEKNPKGSFARFNAFQRISGAKNNNEIIERSEKFLKAFPYQEWYKGERKQGFIYYTTHRSLGAAYFETKQFDKFLAMLSPLDYKTENEVYRWNIFRAYTFKTLGKDTLYNISSTLIKELIAKSNDRSYEEEGVFNQEQAKENAREQLDNQLEVYISLLNDMQKYAEAKEYFKNLSEKGRYANADLNAIHLNVLEKLGQEKEILPLLEMCVKANTMTPLMLDKLKAIYQAKNKDMSGYDKYLASLRSPEEQQALREYVKEHMVNQEYKPFAIENANGELVRSSEWGDKIVVLDFWATWCKPCIAAFPGMQMITDKYANDPAVAIYLVGTMQTGDYKEKSTGYIKQEGYRFNLLHDGINKETGGQDAVFKTFVPFFQSSAIPRKVILKDGVMRYTAEGYSGSPSKLADELTYAIELLKAEK
ncbi:MAG TPA: TlpA disulfide reductase family protein [Chitinophaga sp.]|nr:TlpA disulfide reductase family protein [Chitinophaga sp.]